MISHKNFESNCKRIAKHIVKCSYDLNDDVMAFGRIVIDVSRPLFDDFEANKKSYEKEINKHLENKGVKISNGMTSMTEGLSLTFDVDYNDVDPEVED